MCTKISATVQQDDHIKKHTNTNRTLNTTEHEVGAANPFLRPDSFLNTDLIASKVKPTSNQSCSSGPHAKVRDVRTALAKSSRFSSWSHAHSPSFGT